MSDTSLVYDVIANDKASSTLARVSGSVKTAGTAGNIAGFAAKAGMVAATASTVAWGSAIVGALLPSIYLIPAAVAAAAGATTGFKVATFGLADAWTATSAAMAGGGQSARQQAQAVAAAQWGIVSATHGLQDAQRTAAQAQRDLNQAYVDAQLNLQQLDRDLNRAKLSQEGAALAVKDAQKQLNLAKATGNVDEIARADLALREALATQDEAKAKTQEVATAKTKADAAGVDGSTQVKAALLAQEAAQWQLLQATHQLGDAQQALSNATQNAGSANLAAAQALAKLSPSAQALIATLHQLGPAWTDVRKASQEAMFSGVPGEVRALSDTYLPVLRGRLVELGGAYNGVAREAAGLLQSKQFVADVDTTLHNTATTTTVLGQALVPVVGGFTALGAVGSAYLPQIAGFLRDSAVDFQHWVEQARQSGQLQQWLQGAVNALHSVWDIGGHALGIVLNIFRAADLSGSGGNLLATLDQGAAALERWTGSAAGQEKLAADFTVLRDILGNVVKVLPDLISGGGQLHDTLSVTGVVVKFLADHTGLLASALPILAAGYLVVKAGQTAANVASVVRIPLLAAEVVSNFTLAASNRGLAAAMRLSALSSAGQTTATEANTVATDVNAVTQERGVIALVASKVAMVATTVATGAWTAAQWLLNVALDANPIGLVVLAIAALIGIIVLIATKTDWFQKGWKYAWAGIKFAASEVWDFLKQIPGWLETAFSKVANVITWPYRQAFNLIADAWNATIGKLSWTVPSWVPFIGGNTISVPHLPHFHTGGIVPGAPGSEVLAVLQAGERVIPAGQAGTGGGGRLELELTLAPAADTPEPLAALIRALLPYLRAEIRDKGGNVQDALGAFTFKQALAGT